MHAAPDSRVRKINRNVYCSSGRSSMRLEPEVWSALEEICHREDLTLPDLIMRIERDKPEIDRSSATRVWTLEYFRKAAAAGGHAAAGHGEIEKVLS